MKKLFLFLLLSLCATTLFAANSEVLLKTDKSWNGGSFNYPDGDPEITILKITIAENEEPPFHCHPVPTFGYVLKGSIEVETKAGKKRLFQQGEAVVEVMDTIHRGKPIGGAVELLVFYAGEKEEQNSYPADSEVCISTPR